MKIAIIISLKDPAGLNIKERLLETKIFSKHKEKFKNNDTYEADISKNIVKLYSTPKESYLNEDIDKEIDADYFIFATKHQSKSGIKSLSCHTPGNWGKAEMGGQDSRLCISPAKLQSFAYLKLKENNTLKDFEVVMECTHHGPYLKKPCMFIEIGSSDKEWSLAEPGKIIAKTITDMIENIDDIDLRFKEVAFGIGGQHTCSNIIKALEKKNIAISHVCPKYNLNNLDNDTILEAINRSEPAAQYAILDWKGLREHKERITRLLEENNIRYERTDQMFKIST